MSDVLKIVFPEQESAESLGPAIIQRDYNGAIAATVIERAALLLVERISYLVEQVARNALAGLGPVCRGIAAIAREIGLQTIAQVAIDLEHTLESGDAASIKAVASRLERLAARQLLGEPFSD